MPDWAGNGFRYIIYCCIVSLLGCVSMPENNPGSSEKIAKVNMQLGANYLRQGKLEFALEKLKKSIDHNPALTSAHSVIAIVYNRLGKNELADKHYQESINLTADDSAEYGAVHNNYGVFLCEHARYAEAEVHILRAVNHQLYKTPEVGFENVGVCATRQGKMEKAEGYFRQALQINSKMPRALLNMAQIKYTAKHYLQARAYMQRYHEIIAGSAASLWLGVRIEKKLGNQRIVSKLGSDLTSRFPDSDETQLFLGLN